MVSVAPLEKLFEEVGSLLSPTEIENVVQDTRNYLKSPQYSKLENNDFRSWSLLLQKHGRIGANNLGILENYVAPKSSKTQEIEKLISEFKKNISKSDLPENFVGRENDIEEINRRLENPRVKAVSLFGPPGVGKTTLAFEAAKYFCRLRDDGAFELIDVDLKGTKNLNFLVLQAFGVKTISYELDVIRKHVHTMKKKTLVLLDNVEQFLIRSSGQERDQNFINLLETMMNSDKLKLLLTSREKIDEPSLRKFGLSEYEVKPLSEDLSRNMITQSLGTVNAETLSKVVELSGNKPLLLQGILPIVKADIKSLEEVVHKIEEKLQKEKIETSAADPEAKGKDLISKVKEDSCFEEMFESLTPEQQQETIKLSLFRRAFSVRDAQKLLEKTSSSDTNLTLEFLNQANILSIHDSADKSVERSYEIHPRLQEFLGNLKFKDPIHAKDFAKAEELFYKLFVEKILKLSELLETDSFTAYCELEEQRPNFELMLEIAKKTEHTICFIPR